VRRRLPVYRVQKLKTQAVQLEHYVAAKSRYLKIRKADPVVGRHVRAIVAGDGSSAATVSPVSRLSGYTVQLLGGVLTTIAGSV
jgi:hypothetical protein